MMEFTISAASTRVPTILILTKSPGAILNPYKTYNNKNIYKHHAIFNFCLFSPGLQTCNKEAWNLVQI